ncbi:MAG: AmmeMemoRadiSam system radical SAM enzyme, partial [Gammaproteobacteria bacterium]|nr:AmmeMemoRadiSam system radical SAM enzyme [Gammaproteobacteria bacterium]
MAAAKEKILMTDVGVVPTKYWHDLDDGRVQCDLCPRLCKLHEGQRGLCFVRARVDNQIVLTSYGRSSGYCIDPIEKKPLNHFLPGPPVLSFGTAGCNLACKYCQNWDISKSRELDTLMDRATPEAIAQAAEELGCRSVAYTYNDPVIFHEYAIDVAKACQQRGIKSVAVNAGYVCDEPRAEFYQHMDAANVDLK